MQPVIDGWDVEDAVLGERYYVRSFNIVVEAKPMVDPDNLDVRACEGCMFRGKRCAAHGRNIPNCITNDIIYVQVEDWVA